jgi:hypothetical protein
MGQSDGIGRVGDLHAVDPPLPSVVAALLCEALRVLLFVYLWRRERAEHLRFWAMGFALHSLALGSVAATGSHAPWMSALGNTLLVTTKGGGLYAFRPN